MRTKTLWPLACLLLSYAFVACKIQNPASSDQGKKTTYPIKLTRASKAGDKYHFHAKGKRSLQESASAQGKSLIRTNLLIIEFDGNIEVLEVDPKGEERKISILVSKCTVGTNGVPKSLFTNGTVIVAQERNGEDTFQINGKDVPRAVSEALGIVLDLGGAGAHSDDEIFGTSAPKAVGESWPVNTTGLGSVKGAGAAFEAKEVAGEARLAAVTVLNGEPCLDISASINSTNLTFPSKQGVNLREARFDMNFEGFFPTNTSRRLLKESISAKGILRADVTGPKGSLSRDAVFEESTEREFGN